MQITRPPTTDAAPLGQPQKPVLRLRRKPKSKAQLRAEQRQATERQTWAVTLVQEPLVSAEVVGATKRDWRVLLDIPGRPTPGCWTGLDTALKPFHMSASGPMNPQTRQYLVEIRMARGRPTQIAAVVEGIETLLPAMRPVRGIREFRIKFGGAKYKEKNWLAVAVNGRAQVLSSVHPAAVFEDVRSAVAFISEHRAAAESVD